MNVKIREKENSKIAIIENTDVVINNTQDALDLMATISFEYGCRKIIIPEPLIVKSFFDLKTGVAGEILQKFTNYNVKMAIIGNFNYTSKSLKDFIYESNKGNQVFFLPDEKTAIDRLHGIN